MTATEPSVFFQGSLQDGISLALQQSKVVVTFVTDDGDQSKEWENELLTNDTLRSPLEDKAFVFRLQAGSEEAEFLHALFPVPKKPTLLIIQKGMLQEYIGSTTTKEDLIRRVVACLNQVSAPTPTPAQAPSNATPSQASATPAVSSTAHSSSNEAPSTEQQQPQTNDQAQANAQIQALLLERAKRLEADKIAKEAKEKADKEARAKQRREVTESNEGQSSNLNAAERNYAESIRQRKIQATEERKRILKRIEDDKRERKEREAQERQARQLLSAGAQDESTTHAPPAIPLSRLQRGGSGAQGGEYCNLQVRLLDGSTLRSRFKSNATLSKEVRAWIDADRTDGDAPYTFRIVLTPQPNKAVEPAEEIKSLLSLNLAPSATLVLVPSRYATAYAGGNIASRSFTYVIGIFRPIYTFLFGGILGMLFGHGRPGGNAQTHEEIPLRDLGAQSRIRGVRDREDGRNTQLYNGNSLSFEPRRDDDEDGEGS